MKRRETIKKIMKRKKYWYPYELQTRLAQQKIFWSESTITRELRKMPDVVSLPPTNPKVSRAWTYSIL